MFPWIDRNFGSKLDIDIDIDIEIDIDIDIDIDTSPWIVQHIIQSVSNVFLIRMFF